MTLKMENALTRNEALKAMAVIEACNRSNKTKREINMGIYKEYVKSN